MAVPEDDEDLDHIQVNMEIFEAYTRGYMDRARSFLPLRR